jgi:hypothetical protein
MFLLLTIPKATKAPNMGNTLAIGNRIGTSSGYVTNTLASIIITGRIVHTAANKKVGLKKT